VAITPVIPPSSERFRRSECHRFQVRSCGCGRTNSLVTTDGIPPLGGFPSTRLSDPS
jgi:hypothetical protein